MDILGKVIPVRLLKWSNRHERDAAQATTTVRDRTPNHSVAAGISRIQTVMLAPTTRDTVPMNEQSDLSSHPSTSTSQNASFLLRANNAARQGLNVLSPIAGGIPVAGTPLKASIDTGLVVLNGINTKSQNKENAAHLTRRLYGLRAAISAVPPATASAQHQRKELDRKLDAIADQLKRLDVDCVLGSADVAQDIGGRSRESDAHLLGYIALSQMLMENEVQGLRELLLDNQERLPASVQQGIVFVMDATGREFRVSVEYCSSHELFMRVLKSYFEDNEKDKVLRDFMRRGAYDLYTETETGIIQLDGWSGVRAGTRIVMSAVLEDSRSREKYRCPRCKVWNNCKKANDGWIDCEGCPGRFKITDADRKGNERSSKFGQNAQGSRSRSADDHLRLDLILNFHIRQWLLIMPRPEGGGSGPIIERIEGRIIPIRRRWRNHDDGSLSIQPSLGNHDKRPELTTGSHDISCHASTFPLQAETSGHPSTSTESSSHADKQ